MDFIIDVRAALREFDRRVDDSAPLWYRTPQQLERMMRDVWYCILHPAMSGSALTDYGCRLRDEGHPFAGAVFSYGVLLQDTLEDLKMYHPQFGLNQYHYERRHGKTAILVTYAAIRNRGEQ